jgi:hypothetical protein
MSGPDIFHPAPGGRALADLAPAWPSQRTCFEWGRGHIERACDADVNGADGSRCGKVSDLLQYTPQPVGATA